MSSSTANDQVYYFRCVPSGDGGQKARYLCIRPDADLTSFEGDAVITSTNPRFEGVMRKNWWGFAGKSSADASLHKLFADERTGSSKLAAVCSRHQSSLVPGEVLITDVAQLRKSNFSYVAHVTLPNHPAGDLANDPRPIANEIGIQTASSAEEAEETLRKSVAAAFCQLGCNSSSGRNKVESVALPAVGCGCRGYPDAVAAKIVYNCILDNVEKSANSNSDIRYVEVRCWATLTFRAWRDVMLAESKVTQCSYEEVCGDLFDGGTLLEYTKKKRQDDSCTILYSLTYYHPPHRAQTQYHLNFLVSK